MKKRIAAIALILTGIVAGSLTGCGSGSSVSQEEILCEDLSDKTDQASDAPAGKDVQAKNTMQTDETLQAENFMHTDEALQAENAMQTDKAVQPEETPEPEPFIDKLTAEAQGWGLSFGEPGEQPVGNASPEELKQYDAYFMGDDSEKVIYLTFDCGYENGNTEPILDALKKHDAPATFFVVGHYLESEPELVKRMVEEGHAVGSHTYHHPDINTLQDQEAFQKEMDDVKNLFAQVTGEELDMYYRPPEGKCGITNLKMAKELGYHTIFWSLAYVDWDAEHQPSHEEALEKLTARIHPGAVVLLHNTSQTNGEILDELLTKWEEMGYTFKPLSYMTESTDLSS